MLTLNETVDIVKGEIIVRGRAGCLLNQLLESTGIKVQLLHYIAKNRLNSDNFTFKLGELVVDIGSYSTAEIEALSTKIYCVAPSNEIERHWGVEVSGVVLPEETHFYDILENVSISTDKGCLVSETMKSNSGGTQVHGHIDKLIGLGLLVKRSILATSGPIRSRISSKSTVVHGSKYSSFYDEVADGVKISAGNAYLDRVHDLILNALDQNNVKIMTVKDVARALGLSRWDLQALRNVTLAQKEGGKVKFFEMLCQVFLDNGTLSSARVSWCVSRADSPGDTDDAEESTSVFQCSRSLPLNEAIAVAVASRPEGLTASDIRAITGVTLKRAAKLFALFNKQFGYPVEKVQIGKQLVHKLKAKTSFTDESTTTQRTPHRTASTFSSELSARRDDSATVLRKRLPVDSMSAIGSTASLSLPASALKSEVDLPGALAAGATELVLSDKQQLHNRAIVDYLNQCEGNVANLTDVMAEVRVQHKKRQRLEEPSTAAYTVDRRTIERALQRLEHTLNLVTVVESVNPASLSTGDQSILVILNSPANSGKRDFSTVVADFWERHARKAQRAQDSESRDSSAPRPVRTKRSRTATSSASKKRKAAINSSDSDSDSSYSGSGAESASGAETSDSEGPLPSKNLWRDSLSRPADQNLLAPADLIPQELRKSYRNRSIKQKKTFEDPFIFVEVAHPATEAAGWLVSTMRLHFVLVQALLAPLRPPMDTLTAGKITFILADTLKDLPAGFLLSSCVHLRRQIASLMETGSAEQEQLESCFASAVETRAIAKDIIEAQDKLGLCVSQHVGDVETKRELAGMLAALLAVGVLKLPATSASEEALRCCLAADIAAEDCNRQQPSLLAVALDKLNAGAKVQNHSALKTKRGRDEPLSLHSQQEGDRDHLQLTMQSFASIAVYLNEHRNYPTPHQLVAHLCSCAHELTVRPVGAWQPVRTDLEIYHHWKSSILPSLPIAWDGLDRVSRLTNIARHSLHYQEVHGEISPAIVRADGGDSSYFDNKVKMSHWSNKLIQNAWADTLGLSWTSVRAQQSLQGEVEVRIVNESVPAQRPGTFSLDMPRRGASQRKRQQEGSAAKVSLSARKRAKTEAIQESGNALQALSAVACDLADEGEPTAGFEGEDSGSHGPPHLMDPGLEEEMQSLLACEDIEWTARQVAIVLEAVIIHFFARPYHGQLQSALLPPKPFDGASTALPASRASPHPFVASSPLPVDTNTTEPSNSCFDIDWADTDFSSVAESLLNLAIAATKLPDHQKAAKHRLLQCVKYRPRLRSIVAWIACNKGSVLSNSFCRILNQVLVPAATRVSDTRAELAALSTALQVYGSPVLSGAGVDLLQKHPIDAVSNVTRELFVRGYVRRPDHCGNDQCTAKPCPHKKRTFILSEVFFESQTSILLAPFYADLLERQCRARGALGTMSTHEFVSTLQSEQYVDSLPLKTLAMAQCLSAIPNQLSSRLDVQHLESLRVQSTTVTCTAARAVGQRDSADDDSEEVLLLEQESFEPHSGFCDKTLNSLHSDFVLLASPVEHLPAHSESADNDVDEHSPLWVLPDGSTNVPVLQALCSKVLAVLSEKPGVTLVTLHTSLVVLSTAHTEALLQHMEDRALVRSRRCRSVALLPSSTHRDLFSFNASVFTVSAAACMEEERCFFVNNLVCQM